MVILVKNNLHSTVMPTNIFTSKYNLQKFVGMIVMPLTLKGTSQPNIGPIQSKVSQA